jgi:death-on-curing protein
LTEGLPPEIRYLGIEEVVALHRLVMQRTGFIPAPLRDRAALESAITRPKNAAYFEQADLVRQCALLIAGVAQAQAFMDGNKRTAPASGDVFLRLNGFVLDSEQEELAQQIEAPATRSGSLTEASDRFEQWLRERITKA